MTNLEIIREEIKNEIEAGAELIVAEAKQWEMKVSEFVREIGEFRSFKSWHGAQAIKFEIRERVEVAAHAQNKGFDEFFKLQAEWAQAIA